MSFLLILFLHYFKCIYWEEKCGVSAAISASMAVFKSEFWIELMNIFFSKKKSVQAWCLYYLCTFSFFAHVPSVTMKHPIQGVQPIRPLPRPPVALVAATDWASLNLWQDCEVKLLVMRGQMHHWEDEIAAVQVVAEAAIFLDISELRNPPNYCGQALSMQTLCWKALSFRPCGRPT